MSRPECWSNERLHCHHLLFLVGVARVILIAAEWCVATRAMTVFLLDMVVVGIMVVAIATVIMIKCITVAELDHAIHSMSLFLLQALAARLSGAHRRHRARQRAPLVSLHEHGLERLGSMLADALLLDGSKDR